MQKKRYKYIFVDLDDTIWDFHANSKATLRAIFNNDLSRYFSDFKLFYNDYSEKNRELWTLYAQGLITKDFLTVERFMYWLRRAGVYDEAIAAKINADYLQVLGVQTRLKPFAHELLALCRRRKLPITLISNGFLEIQFRKLRSSDIEHFFDHVVLSETAGALKPDPAIFSHALQLNHAQPDEALMIGDSFEADICGASQMGIDSLFLNNTGQKKSLPKQALQITSLHEAIAFLAES